MRTRGWALTLVATIATVAPASGQSLGDRLSLVLDEIDISGAVIVAKGGRTLHEGGYGLANREWGIPNTPETRFRIGSITKQFTAAAILILQDRGFLSVQDEVGAHVSTVPDSWKGLTIHQLLTHTSGIMHSWALDGFAETMATPTTLDETLARFFAEPLLFEPGTDYQYSGVGYFLLAKVIEEVSGVSYEDFLEEEIFEPLGMNDTGADHPSTVLPRRASGYVWGEGRRIVNAPDLFMPILTGGGNLYSTVRDLARWDWALTRGAVLSEGAYAAMYRPERENYAYGWQVGEFEGRRVIAHSGGVPGSVAYNFRLPSEELDVVILLNGPGPVVDELARRLAKVVLDSDSHLESYFQ
jgi:CubicO group peptidase (beta-lactamase class C family)